MPITSTLYNVFKPTSRGLQALLRPLSKLTLLERLGMPKAVRNNLSRIQSDALSDLLHYISSAQFRLYPSYTDGRIVWGNKLNPNVPLLFDVFSSRPIPGLLWDNFGFRASPDMSFEGEASFTPNVRSSNIKLTPASVEHGDDSLPSTIPSSIMKSFWINVALAAKPATYISGDQMGVPLGKLLIDIYKNMVPVAKRVYPEKFELVPEWHGDGRWVPDLTLPYKMQRSGTWWNNITDILFGPLSKWSAVGDNPNGLSPDSYLAILKQGLRPEYELRFDVQEPMTGWNNTAVNNRFIYDLFEKTKSGEVPQELFIKEFNLWVSPYNGEPARLIQDPNGNTIIGIPHPFLFKKKKGGTLKY